MQYLIRLSSQKSIYLFLSIVMVFGACQSSEDSPVQSLNTTQEFSDYWFQGKAELTSYHLQQARYGELREGSAVLIFVTEDFSHSKQVKLDYPQEAGSDSWKVMKLNATKKFNTGVYPYSMMSSTFTPLDFEEPALLKATISSQEWCGHTFSQVNRKGNSLNVSLKSYFESEGDTEFSIKKTLLEDEIWTMIRLNPDVLPTGNITILPSLFYQRLSHSSVKPISAVASLNQSDSTSVYRLDYAELDRSLSIEFNSSFPHEIYGWDEEYVDGYGDRAKKLRTSARLNKQVMLDYWSRNSLADSVWRQQLNLSI